MYSNEVGCFYFFIDITIWAIIKAYRTSAIYSQFSKNSPSNWKKIKKMLAELLWHLSSQARAWAPHTFEPSLCSLHSKHMNTKEGLLPNLVHAKISVTSQHCMMQKMLFIHIGKLTMQATRFHQTYWLHKGQLFLFTIALWKIQGLTPCGLLVGTFICTSQSSGKPLGFELNV